jgi:hypothetical protein
MNESNEGPIKPPTQEERRAAFARDAAARAETEAAIQTASVRLNVATGLLAGLLSVKEPTITVDAEGNTLIAPSPEVAAGAALAYADELIRQAFK